MKIKKVSPNVYAARLEKEEEIISALSQMAKSYDIGFASLQAIGALKNVELGYFHLDRKQFHKKIFKDDYELLSAAGNISRLVSNETFVHLHASLGAPDFSVIGGHIFSAQVAVTVEAIITVYPVTVHKVPDANIGLNVWDLKNCGIY